MEAATNHFLPESGCPFFLELVIALYLIYSLGTSVKLTNEMATVFPTQNFAGGHFTIVVLLIVLHGLMPSAFSEHLSLNGDVIHGSHTSICQNIVLASSLLAVGVSQNFLKNRDVLHYEYKSLILFSILGLLVLSVSSNLALIYLAIELQSLAFYVLATFGWTSDYSVEAGLKYFVIGSFSSCLLLFGFVLLYINTGSLSFEAMQKVYTEFECFNIVFFSICFSLSALLFKVGAAPFHT
jgi:NADH-quinone oxidoreductase subunit N